jgi:hypothetical protein
MTSLIAPSFHSATTSAQQPTAAAFAQISPWRRILAIEPDVAVLHAKTLLLTEADYCVTPATSDRDLFSLRATKAFALAILSDRLGQRLLGMIAGTIRKQWPRTRILILGQVPAAFEDYRYDEHICRSSDPQKVLADLERLYEGMWNPRSNAIDWNASRSALCFSRSTISESDPTRTMFPAPTESRILRDTPADIRLSATKAS